MVINVLMLMIGVFAIIFGVSRFNDSNIYGKSEKNNFGGDNNETKLEKAMAKQDGIGIIVIGIVLLFGLIRKVFFG